MNFRNQSIGADAVTSTDVNKAILRSLTKAYARHGLGLYIYAGEDLPEAEQPEKLAPYPSRQEMLYEIQKKYPKDSKNREALVNSLGVATIDDMTDAQVMAVYNKVHKP
jgi:hypothetical protein